MIYNQRQRRRLFYSNYGYNRFGAGYLYNHMFDPYLNEHQKKVYLCAIVFSWISKVILVIGIILIIIGYFAMLPSGSTDLYVAYAGWAVLAFAFLVVLISHGVLRCHVYNIVDMHFFNQYQQQQAQIRTDHPQFQVHMVAPHKPAVNVMAQNNRGVVNNGFQQYPTSPPNEQAYGYPAPPPYTISGAVDQSAPPAYGFSVEQAAGSYPTNYYSNPNDKS